MPSLTLPDRLIWFAHCPKAGGTSLERVMVDTWGDRVGHLFWGWDMWFRRGGWRAARPPCSPQHLTWEDAGRVLPRAPDLVFAVVRDPVARMASEHRWQRRGRRATPLGRAIAWLPFSLWLRLMLAMRERHAYAFDNHLRPQADFVPEMAAVFRLEEGLDAPLSWLARASGSAHLVRAEHLLRSGAGRKIEAADRALIGAAFAEDYRRFGYDRPAPCRTMRPLLRIAARCLAPLLVLADRHGWL